MSTSARITTDSLSRGDVALSPMRETSNKLGSGNSNNAAEGDMFSPTSAAALALSTLHQHGADRNKRPEDLKGTRLFIQGGSNEDKEQEEIEPVTRKETPLQSSSASPSPTFFLGGASSMTVPPLPAHYPPPPPGYHYAPDPRFSLPPGASPWQPTQYHQYPNVSDFLYQGSNRTAESAETHLANIIMFFL